MNPRPMARNLDTMERGCHPGMRSQEAHAGYEPFHVFIDDDDEMNDEWEAHMY